MLEGIPKISVLVITYNQEDVISRAINSLLSQKDYIYEICVSDDNSKDRTWALLNEYTEDNPGLFKLNRNDPNLGIFRNLEKTWTMATGDIIYLLSGDDECGAGWFQKVVNYICDSKIDYLNESFCVYGDYMEIYPNGATITHNQALIKNASDELLDYAIRGLVSNRSACFSMPLLKAFKNVSQGRSYMVESAQNRQLQMYSHSNYYISHIGNIYYAGIGVSVRRNPRIVEEQKKEWDYLELFLKEEKCSVNKKTRFFIEYKKNSLKGNKKKAFLCFLKSVDSKGIGVFVRSYLLKLLKKTPFFIKKNYCI